IVWNGFIYQSYLYPELALIMEPKFHEAIKRINDFKEKELAKNIIKSYLSLMINISNDPIKDYISNIFTKETSNAIIESFYFEISRYIESTDKIGINEMFDKWVLQFLDNRTRNYPILITDHEKNLILKFLLKFPDKVGSLDKIFIRLDDYFTVEQETINFLLYMIDITKENSEIFNKVLITITNQMKKNTQEIIPVYLQIGIKDIYEKLSKNGVDIEQLEKNLKFLNIIK
ncbi:MAG: DUF4020 domain-containing protein, partial [Anaerococcus sp.]|nr:DUF4020 domain-containing protein [Anaerococcus sp.]